MAGPVSIADLAESVSMYLDEIAPGLSGRQAFHGKVARNVLAIIAREARAVSLAAEGDWYAARTGATGEAARREYCRLIRSGDVDPFDDGLVARMSTFVAARLAVDNPGFSTLARLQETE
ncbi:hypothetical protein KCG44_07100 [Pacificimonas sp. WHA3]|uniref:DUF6285 domain-containing protein n=1 Tax=Pacificimonas pallii TaxID=2827236 RepID=A0ABS6SDR3_9SPHN|nr:DUF6285 domain-containing protein [Pacificimonas pallii]MBV7256550.1 hypothetical protein [Pacificimonas pallii]